MKEGVKKAPVNEMEVDMRRYEERDIDQKRAQKQSKSGSSHGILHRCSRSLSGGERGNLTETMAAVAPGPSG